MATTFGKITPANQLNQQLMMNPLTNVLTGTLTGVQMNPLTNMVWSPWNDHAGHQQGRQVRRSRYMLKLLDAVQQAQQVRIDGWFALTDRDTLISIFGKMKPVYNGRPQRWMTNILNAVPAPYSSNSKTAAAYFRTGVNAGMFYMMPPLIGRRRITYRATSATLGLLDYWADKHKNFRPFYDAYVTNKARKEIGIDCSTFALGFVPKKISAMEEKQREAVAKENARKQAEWQAQQTWYTTQADMPWSTLTVGQLAGTVTTAADNVTCVSK